MVGPPSRGVSSLAHHSRSPRGASSRVDTTSRSRSSHRTAPPTAPKRAASARTSWRPERARLRQPGARRASTGSDQRPHRVPARPLGRHRRRTRRQPRRHRVPASDAGRRARLVHASVMDRPRRTRRHARSSPTTSSIWRYAPSSAASRPSSAPTLPRRCAATAPSTPSAGRRSRHASASGNRSRSPCASPVTCRPRDARPEPASASCSTPPRTRCPCHAPTRIPTRPRTPRSMAARPRARTTAPLPSRTSSVPYSRRTGSGADAPRALGALGHDRHHAWNRASYVASASPSVARRHRSTSLSASLGRQLPTPVIAPAAQLEEVLGSGLVAVVRAVVDHVRPLGRSGGHAGEVRSLGSDHSTISLAPPTTRHRAASLVPARSPERCANVSRTPRHLACHHRALARRARR